MPEKCRRHAEPREGEADESRNKASGQSAQKMNLVLYDEQVMYLRIRSRLTLARTIPNRELPSVQSVLSMQINM